MLNCTFFMIFVPFINFSYRPREELQAVTKPYSKRMLSCLQTTLICCSWIHPLFLLFSGHRLTITRLLGSISQKCTLIQFLIGSLFLLETWWFGLSLSTLVYLSEWTIELCLQYSCFPYSRAFLVQSSKISRIPSTKLFLRPKSHVVHSNRFTLTINIMFLLLHTDAWQAQIKNERARIMCIMEEKLWWQELAVAGHIAFTIRW